MEKAIVTRQPDESGGLDERRLPIMRTLAKFHECDAETLLSRVECSELDVHEILREMVSDNQVESSGARGETYSLTVKGWGEYLRVLGSIYELQE